MKGQAFYERNMKEITPDRSVEDDSTLVAAACQWVKLLKLGGEKADS